MSQKPRKRFTAEFKAQALELLAAGKPVSELAAELCVSSNLLYNWRQQARQTQPAPQKIGIIGTHFFPFYPHFPLQGPQDRNYRNPLFPHSPHPRPAARNYRKRFLPLPPPLPTPKIGIIGTHIFPF